MSKHYMSKCKDAHYIIVKDLLENGDLAVDIFKRLENGALDNPRSIQVSKEYLSDQYEELKKPPASMINNTNPNNKENNEK